MLGRLDCIQILKIHKTSQVVAMTSCFLKEEVKDSRRTLFGKPFHILGLSEDKLFLKMERIVEH